MSNSQRTPPPHSFLIFILYWGNDHIITDTDMIKVSKGGNDRITFISELRNEQVNQDLFSERIELKRLNLQIVLLKQIMKLIKGIW
jgi:hypothetical protein